MHCGADKNKTIQRLTGPARARARACSFPERFPRPGMTRQAKARSFICSMWLDVEVWKYGSVQVPRRWTASPSGRLPTEDPDQEPSRFLIIAATPED